MESTSSGRRRISDFLKFYDLANVLEKISCADNNTKRKEYLEKYVAFVRKNFKNYYKSLDSTKAEGDSFYCVVRILLPEVDRGRRAYGFKSTSLARMFVKILGIDRNSRDGKRLTEFKDPKRAGQSVGDIASVIFNLLKDRFGSTVGDGVKLSELHETLDKLSRGSESDVNQDQQTRILQTFVRKLSPVEGKWLTRILLKNMHLGFPSTKTAVFSILHPQAKSLSEKIGDLELLCQKINDPSLDVDEIDVFLFNHFRPMLATRMDIIDSAFEASSLGASEDVPGATSKKISKWGKPTPVSLPSPPFYVETKWDGERFQIHYDGHDFKYFSRRAFDFSHKFNETLTPQLRRQIQPGVESFILDGEMMAYHKRYKMFTQKGYNIDVKTMNKDNPNHCPVFVAFDVVYHNGIVLTRLPLKDRLLKLKSAFVPKEDVIRISEVKILNTKEEVIDCLNTAIDNLEEGLIAKDPNSTYEAGKRLETWLKIKPEYLEDNTVEDLDLVILGAYYTESVRRGGEINHFLVGLIDTSKGKSDFYPLAKVGSGRLRSPELKELVKELEPQFVRTTVANVCWKARKKPDFMIAPEKSVVVQVKASEIIPSDVYACNYTLRFPRIVKVRKDKSPSEIMEVREFLRIREACGGKLAKRTDNAGPSRKWAVKRKHSDLEDSDSDEGEYAAKMSTHDLNNLGESEPLPGPSRPLLAVSRPKALFTKSPLKLHISPSKPKNTLMVQKHSTGIVKNVFNSKVFCVYGSTSWKADLENNIRKYGGNITQSPDVKVFFAIVGEKRSVLVRKAIQSKKYDVLNPNWIQKCIDTGVEVPLLPMDYWSMTSETYKQFSEEYDEYGDSYTKENSLQETEELLQRILRKDGDSCTLSPHKSPLKGKQDLSDTDDGNSTDASDSTDFSENELMNEIFAEQKKEKENPKEAQTWNFMSDVKVAFRGNVDYSLRCRLEFYGGKIVNEDDDDITHVAVSKTIAENVSDHSSALVVKLNWLEKCFAKKKVVDEMDYIIA